jgi:6-phosphogluconolactonase
MTFKNILFLIVLINFLNCKKEKVISNQSGESFNFYVGTYTDSTSQGIYKYALHKDGSLEYLRLAAIAENPSYLVKSPDEKFLLAVNEINNKDSVGAVESFLIKPDSLQLISRSSSGGADPCFISINKNGYVITANYTGGNLGLLKLLNNGKLSPLLNIEQHSGQGINDRQKGPHAHFASFLPEGRNNIISVDLGTNALWFSTIDTLQNKLVFDNPKTLDMERGAGPRHLVFHPNGKWIYVLNELNNTVTMVAKDDHGFLNKKFSISTLPNDFTQFSKAAEIQISMNGKFIYASNRGHDSIAIFSVDESTGALQNIAFESTHGSAPRHFTLSPDENFILVANQNSNNLVSFKRDAKTGLLKYISEIKAPNPVCILF